MKKLLFLTFVVLFYFTTTKGQVLSDIYKKGTVNLDEVAGYGTKNNWTTLFSDYNLVQYGSPVGKRKRIVVAPDGSVFMSHRSLHEIWKFDKNGNFVKKIGKQGSAPDQFLFVPDVGGILDGKYVFAYDNQGKIKFFDLEGKFIKMLKIDYMPLQIIPLKNSKIAIVGYTSGKNIVTIKDFNTSTEKTILSVADPKDDGHIRISLPKGGMFSISLPFSISNSSWTIASNKSGNLVVASADNGKITEYSTDGVKLEEFDLNITPLKITDGEITEYYETALKNMSRFEEQLRKNKKYTDADVKNIMTQYKTQIIRVKDRKFYPAHLPYFSDLIIDSEGNLVVFEYTKEDVSNSFRAYTFSNKGKFICTSSFKNSSYELNFEPRSFVINNGSVYALAFKNNCKEVPLRLVKFSMSQK